MKAWTTPAAKPAAHSNRRTAPMLTNTSMRFRHVGGDWRSLDLRDPALGVRNLKEKRRAAKVSRKEKLQRVPRRAHEIAQDGHVWPIGADTPRIDGQSEPLGQIQIHAGIIQFRKTESLRGQHTVQPCRIHWPRRPATPRASGHLVELLPIAFAPGRHAIS